MTICAALLYLLFIFSLTSFLGNRKLSIKFFFSGNKEFAATCFLLSAFLFVPVETLPPMVDIEFGSLITLILIILANCLQERKQQNFLFVTFLAIIFALFSLLVYFCGIPGHLFCIQTYSSPLIWEILSKVARTIYILVVVLFATLTIKSFLPKTKKEEGISPLSELFILLYIAMFCAIFTPPFSFTMKNFSFISRLFAFWIGWAKILTVYGMIHCFHLLRSKNS